MSKLNLIVPNPDGSGRYCVYDPVAGRYVRGGINISRLQAERLVRDARPQQWEDLARAAGWLPPGEVARRLEEQAALTEQALRVEPEQEQTKPNEPTLIDSIGPGDEL